MATRKKKSDPEAPALAGTELAPPRGFDAIVGQSRAVGVLRALLAGGRLANAYLFEGPWGVGKTTTALAFARALLCTEHGADGCGTCSACLRVDRFQHPDLRFLFPVSGEESALEATLAETFESLRTDPFYLFTYEKAASIRLSLTRELLRELSLRPYEAERRVVVVRDADRMRTDQYSAMLKSLEEPGQSTVWVLTTSRTSRLPATIRSRCLQLRFGPLAESEIEATLVSRAGIDVGAARLLAAIAAGSLGRALLWREEDIAAARDDALEMMRPALRGDTGGMLEQASKLGRGWNREKIRRVLEFQSLWIRDVLRLAHGIDAEQLVNRDRLADLKKSAERVGVLELKRRITILEEVGRAVEGNVNPEMAFFSALARIGKKVPERADDWPAHRVVAGAVSR